ncbi:MAG: gliding motility protein GldC [Bacteroidota bacterium]|jgi:gliding motility-associated protein GldC
MLQNQLIFNIDLDDTKTPETISWQASQTGNPPEPCKAMLVSIWDAEAKQTLKIDLWTKDMPLEEMNLFFYQTLHTMADTLKRSTANEEASLNLKAFANMFGENTGVVKKIENN